MPRITISYRRGDSLDVTGRIFDRLAQHFGRESVFRDIDNIPAGVDFRRHLETTLDTSDMILAIVGPRWIGPRAGQSRLASTADPVRVEIEIALAKEKPLIPVLVSRAVMPTADQLPESLHDFAYRNAVQVDSGQDFDVHMGRLIRAIERIVEIDETEAANGAVRSAVALAKTAPQIDATREEPAPPAPRRSGWPIGLAAVVVLALLAAGGWWVFVAQPAEMARREAAAADKARAEEQARETAAVKAQQDEQARQAAAAKAQQEQQAREAAMEKAQQEQQAQQAAAAKAQQEEQAREAAAAKAEQDEAAHQTAAASEQEKGQAALDKRDYAEAMRWSRMAADQGNADAENNVGTLYALGYGVRKDYAEAMRWFRMAADQRNASAEEDIGEMYDSGWGVKQDYAEGMRWLRMAAKQNNAVAQYNIGLLYQNGHGVTQDYTEAMRWYRLSADQGEALAENNIGNLYYGGFGVARDLDQARQWWRKAAADGNESAKQSLAKHGG